VKLKNKINKSKIKQNKKRSLINIYYKAAELIIGKPYIFIENFISDIYKKRMNRNISIYKRKVVNEIVKYIQYCFARYGSDRIIISENNLRSSFYDDYEADIRLDQFIGYGFSPRKFNKISRKFYDYVISGNKEKDKIYSEILVMVLDYFRTYEDVEIIRKKRSSKDYWVIKMK